MSTFLLPCVSVGRRPYSPRLQNVSRCLLIGSRAKALLQLWFLEPFSKSTFLLLCVSVGEEALLPRLGYKYSLACGECTLRV
jgi:hypothetical protein